MVVFTQKGGSFYASNFSAQYWRGFSDLVAPIISIIFIIFIIIIKIATPIFIKNGCAILGVAKPKDNDRPKRTNEPVKTKFFLYWLEQQKRRRKQ